MADQPLCPDQPELSRLRARVEELERERSRLVSANEHWHLRVSQLNTSLSASTDRVEELEGLVDESVKIIGSTRAKALDRAAQLMDSRASWDGGEAAAAILALKEKPGG